MNPLFASLSILVLIGQRGVALEIGNVPLESDSVAETIAPVIAAVSASACYGMPPSQQDRFFVLMPFQHDAPLSKFDPLTFQGVDGQMRYGAQSAVLAFRVASDKTYLQQSRPEDPPLFPIVATGPTTAQILPAFCHPEASYTTPEPPGDRFFLLQTTPQPEWIYPVTFAASAVTWPAVEAGTDRDYRSRRHNETPIPTEPNDGWEYGPVSAGVATTWPAIESGTDRDYRSRRHSEVPIPTTPNDGWNLGASAAVSASYAPAWWQEASGYRTPDRQQDRTFILQTTPEINVEGSVVTPEAFEYSPVSDQQRNGSYRTPPRSIDVRPTEPNAGWVAAVSDAAIAVQRPAIAETPSSYAATARVQVWPQTRPLDGWDQSFVSAFSVGYWPAIEQGTDRDYRSRRHAEASIPSQPNDGWGYQVTSAANAVLWPAIEAGSDRDYRSGKRADAPIATVPLSGWEYAPATANLGASWPAIEHQLRGYRTPDRRQDRTFILQTVPQPNFEGAVVTPEAFEYVPVSDQQRAGGRTPPRSTDVRPTEPNAGWIYAPATAALGSYAPGIEQQLRSYRTPDSRADRYFLQQTAPEIAWLYPVTTPFEVAFYVPVGNEQGRVAAYRTPDPRQDKTLILQTQPETIYEGAVYTFDATDYVAVADQQRSSYRVTPRSVDARRTEPNAGWNYAPVAANLGAYWPGVDEELRTYRAPERQQDRCFILQTQPEISWLYQVIAPFEVRTYVPITDQQRNGSYVSRLRSTDVRQTQPNEGWQQRVVDAAIAQYVGIAVQDRNSYRSTERADAPVPSSPLQGWEFARADAAVAQRYVAQEQELGGYRAGDRQQDRTFILQTRPEPADVTATEYLASSTSVPAASSDSSASAPTAAVVAAPTAASATAATATPTGTLLAFPPAATASADAVAPTFAASVNVPAAASTATAGTPSAAIAATPGAGTSSSEIAGPAARLEAQPPAASATAAAPIPVGTVIAVPPACSSTADGGAVQYGRSIASRGPAGAEVDFDRRGALGRPTTDTETESARTAADTDPAATDADFDASRRFAG